MRKSLKLSDALTLTGLCSLEYGLYLFRPALAFIVLGLILAGAGVLLSMPVKEQKETEEETPD